MLSYQFLNSSFFCSVPSEEEGLTMQDLLKDEVSESGTMFINYLLEQAKSRGIQIMMHVCDANPILKSTIRMIFASLVWHLGLGTLFSRFCSMIFNQIMNSLYFLIPDILLKAFSVFL